MINVSVPSDRPVEISIRQRLDGWQVSWFDRRRRRRSSDIYADRGVAHDVARQRAADNAPAVLRLLNLDGLELERTEIRSG
jgi:hypothetical protein